jgi:hypothetical protein
VGTVGGSERVVCNKVISFSYVNPDQARSPCLLM